MGGVLKRWDDSAQEWVKVGLPLNVATETYVDTTVDNATPHVGTSAPSSPAVDDLWYDTGNDLWKRWDGSEWQEAGGGGGQIVTATYAGDDTAGRFIDVGFTPAHLIVRNTGSDQQWFVLNGLTDALMIRGGDSYPSTNADLFIVTDGFQTDRIPVNVDGQTYRYVAFGAA